MVDKEKYASVAEKKYQTAEIQVTKDTVDAPNIGQTDAFVQHVLHLKSHCSFVL